MVVLFTEKELDEIFNEIAATIDFSLEGFLIGGLAMIKNNLKASTKDIDIVFSDEEAAKEFVEAALKVRFTLDEELPPEYEEMKTMVVLKDSENRRIDVFDRTVLRGLTYSESMKSRAKTIEFGDKLTIHVSSIEDIFLYKSITSRPRDLDDMEILARTAGLNWSHIENEARNQPTPWKWIGRLYGRLLELEEKSGIVVPIMRKLKEEAEDAQAIELILGFLEEGPVSKDNVIERIGEAEFTEEIIRKMIELGLIREEQRSLILVS